MAIEKIALKNVDKVVDNDVIDVTSHMDIITASAYEDSVESAQHLQEVTDELTQAAKNIPTPDTEETKVTEDNMYTKKIKLDESIADFDLKSIDGSNDDDDRYVEYDMFDFIYSLFATQTDSLIRPLKALSNKRGSAFMYQGSDDYIDDNGQVGIQGVGQVSTNIDGNIVLYQDTVEAFDDVIDICHQYNLSYEGPVPKRAPWLRWNYSLTIVVPTYTDGYPMDVDDYFEQQGIPLQDVMPSSYLIGRDKDHKKMADELAVETTFNKYVRTAGRNGDKPLDFFINSMFKELKEKNIKYDKKTLKNRFLSEFSDDFEDEE